MTTKVTIEAYNYPVLIEEVRSEHNNPTGKWQAKQSIQPFEKIDFTLSAGVQFKLTELPQYAKSDQPKTVSS